MHSKSSIFLLLIGLLIFTGEAPADSSIYASVGFKSVTWTPNDPTSAIEYDENIHKEVDFSFAIGDNYIADLVLDIDEEIDDLRKIGVRLGFEKWGMYIDKGTISGKFGIDPGLNFNPVGTTFSNDYLYLAIYKGSGWSGAFQEGIGYAKWQMPSRAVVNYNDYDEVIFVDPESTYEVIGYFLRYDYLRSVVVGSKRDGWNLETSLLVGYSTVTPGVTEVDRVQAITGTRPDTATSGGIGGINTVRVGYYSSSEKSDYGTAWGYSIGYELQQYGNMMSFDDSVLDNDKIFPDEFGYIHGPFIKFAATW